MITVTLTPTGVLLKGEEVKHEISLPDKEKPSIVDERFYGFDKLESFKIWKGPEMKKPNIKLVWYENSVDRSKDTMYKKDLELFEGVDFPEMKGAEFKCWWTRKMVKPEKWTRPPTDEVESAPAKKESSFMGLGGTAAEDKPEIKEK